MSASRELEGPVQVDALKEPKVSPPICPSHLRPSLPQRTGHLGRRIYSRIDCWVVILLIAAALAPLFVRRDPPLVPRVSFPDDSWELDLAFKALHHVWMMRDQLLTYGPLYQAISGLLPWLRGFSLGGFYRSNLPVQFCVAVLLLYMASISLLRWQPGWKRAFYIFLMSVFWWPGNSKSAVSVCAFSLITVLVQALADLAGGVLWRAGAASVIVLLSFLFSMDCGAQSLAAVAIAMIMAFFCSAREPAKLTALVKFGALTAGYLSLAALAVNHIVMGSLFDFGFWHAAFEVVDMYRWFLPSPMTDRSQTWLMATTALSLLIFLIAWLWRNPHSRHITQRPIFLQGACAFSALSLQTVIIRSDWEHVALGLFPVIAMAVAVLVGFENEPAGWTRSHAPAYLALLLTAIFTGPVPFLRPSGLLAASDWKQPAKYESCPEGTYLQDQACFRQADFAKLHAVSSAVQNRVASSDSIAVFPYENIYGVAARRLTGGGILQNYFVGGDYLTNWQIRSLARDKSPLLVYSMDGLAALPVDHVSNFTRTPRVWLYFQQHYVEESEPEPGILLLRRDDLRAAKWRIDTADLMGAQETDHLRGDSPLAVEDLSSWPDHVQFLKLDITVHYPFWWKFLKPCRLTVDLTLSDGSHKLAVVLPEPNRETQVWVYPGDELQLRNYFSDNAADWRAAAPAIPVSHVALWLEPIDSFSVAPTSITIRNIQAVRLSLGESLR